MKKETFAARMAEWEKEDLIFLYNPSRWRGKYVHLKDRPKEEGYRSTRFAVFIPLGRPTAWEMIRPTAEEIKETGSVVPACLNDLQDWVLLDGELSPKTLKKMGFKSNEYPSFELLVKDWTVD